MEFLEHLKIYLSEEEIVSLATSLSQKSEHALLLNTAKLSQERLLELFPSLKKHPIVNNAFLYEKEQLDLGKSIYHELGCFYLQEPSAMVPAFLLNPSEEDIVLDLCAAPGGKSVQASFLMNNKGLIIANDIARNRAFAISENAERLGLGNLLITNNDFSSIYHHFVNTFDKIILDAPCSGSGMFRKENKMKEDWSYQKVLKCAEIQKSLIDIAYEMLKPGGLMVYSTCSFSYEEDEEIVKHLLNHTDASLEEIPYSDLYHQSKSGIGVHLFPSIFPGEGQFIALIKKPGQIIHTTKKKEKNDSLYKIATPYPYIKKYGDYLYTMPLDFNVKHLNVIRYGVKVGQIDKNDIRYDYHYAHFINDFSNILEIKQEDVYNYCLGESINEATQKGYVLLRYQGINIDIAKSDGRLVKNRLPKGLRKKLLF